MECGSGGSWTQSQQLPTPLRVRGEQLSIGVGFKPDSSRSARVTRLGCWVGPRLIFIKRLQVATKDWCIFIATHQKRQIFAKKWPFLHDKKVAALRQRGYSRLPRLLSPWSYSTIAINGTQCVNQHPVLMLAALLGTVLLAASTIVLGRRAVAT